MNPHVCWRICVRSWTFILRLHVFVNGCNCTFDSLILPWWSLQVSIRQTLVLPRVYVVENACELSTVLLSEHMNPHVCWRICVRSWMFILRLHVFLNGCNCTLDSLILPWWSLQVSIRQTLILPRVYVVENACELYTVLLSEHMNPHVWWRICVRSWMFILRLHVFVNSCNCTFDSLILPWWSLQVSIRQTLVLPRVYVVENACELSTVLLSEHMNPHVWWRICVRSWMFILRLHVFVNGCNCTFDSLILPWWSLQVSIRQTLVLPRVYVVENACELSTVLLSEHMNPHVCWRICVRSGTFILRLHVFVNGCKWTFDSFFCYDDPVIRISSYTADPWSPSYSFWMICRYCWYFCLLYPMTWFLGPFWAQLSHSYRSLLEISYYNPAPSPT